MRLHWSLAVALIAVFGGCGGPPAPGKPPGPAGGPSVTLAPAPLAMPKEPEVTPLPLMSYGAKGRRDPFASLDVIEGPKGLSVASVKLVGILDGRQERLALVEAPDGLGYVLRTGDVLGDGRVVEIARDSVTFSVPQRRGSPTRTVLRLRTN